MFWALKPSESFKNLMILKVPGLLELLLAMPGFQNQWKSMILKVPGPWSFCWLGQVSRTNENQSFWRSLASWSFCWPCQASRTNDHSPVTTLFARTNNSIAPRKQPIRACWRRHRKCSMHVQRGARGVGTLRCGVEVRGHLSRLRGCVDWEVNISKALRACRRPCKIWLDFNIFHLGMISFAGSRFS